VRGWRRTGSRASDAAHVTHFPRAAVWSVIVVGAILAACTTSAPTTTNGSTASVAPTTTNGSTASVAPTAAASATPSTARACPNSNGGVCLGRLRPGTYSTTAFEPTLTYTVPDGWDNEEDLDGNFLLLPPGMALEGVDAGTSDYIGVYTSVRPDPSCSGASAAEPARAMATCIARRHDLIVTKPKVAKVGRRSGYVMDIRLAAGEDGTSLMVGLPPSSFEHGLIPGLTIRLYVLNSEAGVLAIEVDDVDHHDLATYSKVVDDFAFAS